MINITIDDVAIRSSTTVIISLTINSTSTSATHVTSTCYLHALTITLILTNINITKRELVIHTQNV